jgi:hypothetical protein
VINADGLARQWREGAPNAAVNGIPRQEPPVN